VGQRLGPIAGNVNWMAPHALAAQLIAQAGESKGAGYASLGRSIGAGIAQFGESRREEKRFNLNRQDRLAEQAADNARLERELQMRQARENNGILERREEMVTGNLRALMAAGAQESDPQVQELVSQLGRIQSSYQNNLAMTGAGQGVMPGQDFADLPKPPPIPDAKVVPGLTDSAAGPQGPVQVIDALERLRSAQSRLAELSRAFTQATDPKVMARVRTEISNQQREAARAEVAVSMQKAEPKPMNEYQQAQVGLGRERLAADAEARKARQQTLNAERQAGILKSNEAKIQKEELIRSMVRDFGVPRDQIEGLAVEDIRKLRDAKLSLATSKERRQDSLEVWRTKRAETLATAKQTGVDKSPEFIAADRVADAAARVLSNAESHLRTVMFNTGVKPEELAAAQQARDDALIAFRDAESRVNEVLKGAAKPGEPAPAPSGDITDKYAALRKAAAGGR